MASSTGDMDINDDAPALCAPDGTEDSIDIYEGLDLDSSSNDVALQKTEPSGLKEAMDLFEEIVTEEQQSKDASYTELKSRFQAAQSQLAELHGRLEQLQSQNTGLSKENYRLKMNISILLQTARQEVTRKDAEIQRLNKEHCLQPRHPRDPGCLRRNQRPAPPPPSDRPASFVPLCSSRPRLMPSKEPAPTPPAPLFAPPALSAAMAPPLPDKPPVTTPPPPPPPPPPMPKEASSLPERPPLPPAPTDPPPPPMRLKPISPLREVSAPLRKETDKCTEPGVKSSEQSVRELSSRRSSQDYSCTSERSEKHRHHKDKHKDRKHKSNSERKDSAKLNPSDRHERRHSHKDRTSNFGDSTGEKNSIFVNSDKGHGLREGWSRDNRKDGTRDRQSRGSGSKERRYRKDSPRPDHRRSKDQPSKESQQEWRMEDRVKRHHRDLAEKHRSKDHSKKSSKQYERLSKEKTVSKKVIAEENSPHRKLCFMETLNLTLSPIKKPTAEGGQDKSDKAVGMQQDGQESKMEGTCIGDAVDSSEPEAASLGSSDSKAETPKKTISDKIKHNEAVDNTKSTDERLDDNSVRDISSKAEIEKEDSLTSIGKQLANMKEIPSITVLPGELFSKAAESVNSSVSPNSTMNVMESAASVGVESKSEAPSQSSEVPLENAPVSPPGTQRKDSSDQEVSPKEVETVSSSISLESLPQEGLSLSEAIDFLTQNKKDCTTVATSAPDSPACIEVSNVSSTTQETTASDLCLDVSKTPKKFQPSPAKFLSPSRSSEKCSKPTSSVPLLHDEDSMMRTLSSLKRIPDAISPLRSPVRISKRNLQLLQKPGHVKSLQREFSSAPADSVSKKVDVNKENEHPGSPAKADAIDGVLAVALDTDLEEGEILSESDETASSHPPTKKAKLKRPVRTKASPKCFLKHKMEEKRQRSVKESSESPEATASPTNRSRFKTVSPAETKASFSSIEEVMDTFKLVRYEIRKKYMKLHKTFPQKSFFGVMENFQESFIEFVDGANLSRICNRTKELKSNLKKIITTVFSKMLDNGIVRRLFDQQAVDLKQKLWDFVDVQVDYLFKDVSTALKGLCKPARSPVKRGNAREKDKRRKLSPGKSKLIQSPRRLGASEPCAIVPFRTGLGSRGKGIRISLDKSDDSDKQNGTEQKTVVSIVSSPEKLNSLVVASNSSMLDKTDFELLTEQQASSLTFNLVRDSQMGEIFKCLLQGSDLLDGNAAPGDHSTWALSTPRKDGERIITITTPGKFQTPSKYLTPSKFESPSRLISTWSSISPRKVSSPTSKVLLNPALFDESCLLEVPSEKICHRPYSILAEDLAVSLTIPSPLKSDSHLSFLQPTPVQVLSTPDSVLSAHISEDALLDEADATEHDIRLTLDSDNSSCCSSASVGSSHGMSTQFLFKPSLPMQALVMERSMDHFVVKIRQASSCNSTLIEDESLSQTLLGGNDDDEGSPSTGVQLNQVNGASIQIQAQDTAANQLRKDQTDDLAMSEKSNSRTSPNAAPQSSTSTLHLTDKPAGVGGASQGSRGSSEVTLSQTSSLDEEEIVSESERGLTIAEDLESTPEKAKARKHKDRKRRKNLTNPKGKRCRMEGDSDQGMNCEATGEEPLSPNSLPARNVVRRKGEVVVAWTREEDRSILLELKTKGASRETFSYLSEKLDKPSAQIAQRFHQLMKLFKKMDT